MPDQKSASPWLHGYSEESSREPVFRLLLFHYAGAGASVFQNWATRLPDHIELTGIQLPGRENRFDDPFLYSISDVCTDLLPKLSPLLDKPFGIFGHSMGSLIGFEAIRLLRRKRLPMPDIFIASAQNAPQVPAHLPVRHTLPDDEFAEIIRKAQGTPEILLKNPSMLNMLLPRLRADGAISENYQYRPGAPLPCPVIAMYGAEDDMVSENGMEAWQEQTDCFFQIYRFSGGHFFIHDREKAVVDILQQKLMALSGGRINDRMAG